MSSAALTSPSAERNKGAIGDVLAKYIPEGSNETEPTLVGLEIAAGYGSHMMYNSERFPQVDWIITEKDPNCINSLLAHINSTCPSRANIKGPFTLDLSAGNEDWPHEVKRIEGNLDLVLSINLLHITAWENVRSLFALASKVLKPNGHGKLFTYGPFAFQGSLVPESNVEFDKYLRLNNSEWGIRDVVELEKEASREGNMSLIAVHDMPANNKVLVWATSPP